MKQKNLIRSLTALIIGFLAQPLIAGELLIGAKGGLIAPDYDVYSDSTDPFAAVTLGIGYEFLDLVAVDIGAEVEYTSSITEGEISNNEYNYESIGLIFSLRTAGPVYFIGRAGMQKQEVDFTNDSIAIPESVFSSDDRATVVGAGIGFSTGVRWEIQLDAHTYQNKDDTLGNEGSAYYLNIGLSF